MKLLLNFTFRLCIVIIQKYKWFLCIGLASFNHTELIYGSRTFLCCGFLRIFWMEDHVICREFYFFHSNLDAFFFPPCLIPWLETPVMLNRSVKNIPDHMRAFSLMTLMWAVGFSQMTFIRLKSSLYSQLAEFLSWNSIRFCQLLSASIKTVLLLSMLINFQMLNQPCILGIHLPYYGV